MTVAFIVALTATSLSRVAVGGVDAHAGSASAMSVRARSAGIRKAWRFRTAKWESVSHGWFEARHE